MVYSDEEIVSGLKSGDTKVLHALYEKYRKLIEIYGRKHYRNSDDAQDVLQETMVALIRNIRKGTYKNIHIHSYITIIYKNQWKKKIRDSIRKENKFDTYQKEKAKELELTQNEKDELNLQERKIYSVGKNLDQLTEGCRNIIKLRLWEKKSHREIANIQNITEGSSRTKYLRCLEKLKQFISNDPDFPLTN